MAPLIISSSDLFIKFAGHGRAGFLLSEKIQLAGITKAHISGKNQIIDAKVKQIISSSRAELIIAGKTILADISLLTDNSFVLNRGDTIKLEVTEEGIIKVQISDASASETGQFNEVKGTDKIKTLKSVPLSTGFNEITRVATPVIDLLSNDGAGLIKILKSFFDSGENKDLSEAVQKFQVLNSHLAESGKYLIPFPVFFNGNMTLGQVFFNTGDKQKEKEKKKNNQRVIIVSMLLNMSNLGAIRVDMSVLKKDISGMIHVVDQDICNFIKIMIPNLKKRLNKHDFSVLKMDCKVSRPENLESTSLLDEALHNETNGLNIII